MAARRMLDTPVKTRCYGEEQSWDSRRDAMAFFKAGIDCSEGSERERYSKIFWELVDGYNYATDEE